MTSIDEPLPADVSLQPLAATLESRWQRADAWLSRQSDRLHPILVKEARQALRSRQFTLTFMLMLAAGWCWSILGLAMLGPSAYYSATGPSMFTVYFVILAAPLTVVIPYYAYSSLASERHDRTFELVSITSLEASGILWGKLCGAGLQMLIYLSALFPCLAFTYLLRGLDIFSVLMVVLYTCLISLGLSLVGLLLATLSPSRQRYIIIGVIFAVTLFYVCTMVIAGMTSLVAFEGLLFDDETFWQVNMSFALLYGNAVALVFLAARARLLASSQNRSTALRIALSLANFSAIGWSAYFVARWGQAEPLLGLLFFATVLWYFAGTIIVGEGDQLSPRMRRGLPQTTLGRMLFSWFMPGSGTGYQFVISQMLLLTVAFSLISTDWYQSLLSENQRVAPSQDWFEALSTGIIATSYIAIYLGMARLILGAVRRYDEVRLPMRILVGVLLILVFACGPWVLQLTNPTTRSLDYTLLQTTNPIWTLGEYCFSNGPPAGIDTWLLLSLPLIATAVWSFNLPSVARQLAQGHIKVPERLVIEDRELAAAAARAKGPSSPWDS